MKCFFIDTSTNYLYLAISIENKIIEEVKMKLDNNLSSFTLLKIREMLGSSKMTMDEIDKIILVNGPGSFTGIRIGVTIAKIISFAKSIEITCISTLDAMSVSTETEGYKVPIIDARRGYVYAGIYDNLENKIIPNQYIKLEELNEKLRLLNRKITIITNDNIETGFTVTNYEPKFTNIIAKYREKASINPHFVEPEYLKKTEAEEKRNH